MKYSVEEVNSRMLEIPMQIESLKAELNQLRGYKAALEEMKESKDKKGAKKSDS
tara:strand:+ start:973 stop:1134 length:162 start_codon:yes stop_codon:yes gene_type:complete